MKKKNEQGENKIKQEDTLCAHKNNLETGHLIRAEATQEATVAKKARGSPLKIKTKGTGKAQNEKQKSMITKNGLILQQEIR